MLSLRSLRILALLIITSLMPAQLAQAISIKEFNLVYSEYEKAKASGDSTRAEILLGSAAGLYALIDGAEKKVLAELYYDHARLAALNENWPVAVSASSRCLRLYALLYGKENPNLLGIIDLSGDARIKLLAYRTAEETYIRGINIVDGARDSINPAIAGDMHLGLARSIVFGNDDSRLVKHAKIAADYYKQTPAPKPLQLGQAIYLEGLGKEKGGYTKDALKKYGESIAILENNVEPNHQVFKDVRHALAKLETKRGNYIIASKLVDAVYEAELAADPNKKWFPLLMKTVPPKYPDEALNKNIQGWAKIGFTLTKKGRVKNAKVLDYEGSSLFGDAALKSIKKWKFVPVVKDGKRVDREGVEYTISFKFE